MTLIYTFLSETKTKKDSDKIQVNNNTMVLNLICVK